MHSELSLRRLVAQRFMEALGLIPDAVELPADLALGQRRVPASVDLLRLVVSGSFLIFTSFCSELVCSLLAIFCFSIFRFQCAGSAPERAARFPGWRA